MAIPSAILNQTVTVRRRTSTGRDALNNPNYGAPTSGVGWDTVYTKMPVKLAFSTKQVRFAPEGERILPTGVVYYNAQYLLKAEDRVITDEGVEYNVISVQPGNIGSIISHYEA